MTHYKKDEIYLRSVEILNEIIAIPNLTYWIDASLPIPEVYLGGGDIKLIILGQDPTVKNVKSRAQIQTVLNLDRDGSLRRYLELLCIGLGLKLDENIYATNYLKNFFVERPTEIKKVDIFEIFSPYWLPLLQFELAGFPNVPVITLGEPLLKAITNKQVSAKVAYYWRYHRGWRQGKSSPFRYQKLSDNILNRVVFPFPHQPSWQRKKFYQEFFDGYLGFVRSALDISTTST